MPPRTFKHWYRGVSVETASRSLTPRLRAFRGSFVAPLVREISDQSAAWTGGLRTGGSSLLAVEASPALSQQMTTGGSASPSTAIAATAVANLEILAAANALTSSTHSSGGGWSTAGCYSSSTSIELACSAGVEAAASAGASLRVEHTPEWACSLGGHPQTVSHGVEPGSGGLWTGPSSTVMQAHSREGVGGSSFGGLGMSSLSTPGRSFKYWLRGRVVGDIGPRRGDFALGFRGWLGVASSGKVGGSDLSGQATGGLRVGGSAGGTNRIDGRISGVAAIGPGGTAAVTQNLHVDAYGAAAHMAGFGIAGVGISLETYVTCAAGGAAESERTASKPAIATWVHGGVVPPHLDGTHNALAVLAVAPAGLHRIGVNIEAPSGACFGSSARVGVAHGAGSGAKGGAKFGGAASENMACAAASSGGLETGGSFQIPSLGIGLIYRVYSNGGLGGAIDYSSPIAEVDGQEWVSEPLAVGASFRFGVRSYDPARGLEEENIDAAVSLNLDHAGRDVTRVPRAPIGLRAIDLGSGRVRLEWTDAGRQGPNMATAFHVYISQESIVDFSSPIIVLAGASRGDSFATEIGGLLDGRQYAAVVRSRNSYGEEGNVSTIHFTVDSTPPSQVDGLSASVSASIA